MPRVVLTPAERATRKRAQWDAILNQSRPYAVPRVDEVVEEFRRRFASAARPGMDAQSARSYFGLSPGFDRTALRRAFRARIFEVHPDRGGSADEARRCVVLYELLAGTVS